MNDFDDMSLLEDIYSFEFESVNITRISLQTMLQYEMYGDTEVMMEGVRDIFSNMAAAIRRLIDAITGFFSRFLRIFQSQSMDHAKFCDKWGDAILNAITNSGDKVIFTMKGYDFKVMDRPDPNMDSFDKVVSDYNWALTTLSVGSAARDGTTKIPMHIAEYKTAANEFLSDENINRLRGEVLGTKKPIAADDFADEIHEFYYGSKDAVTISVTPNIVQRVISRADNLKQMNSRVMKNKSNIIRLLRNAEAFFSKKADLAYEKGHRVVNMQSFTYDVTRGSSKTQSTSFNPGEQYLSDINSVINLTYHKTKTIASIINTVITAQSKALVDMMRQDRKLLTKAPGSPLYKDDDDDEYDYVDDATNYIDMDRMSDRILSYSVINGLTHEIMFEGAWMENACETGVVEDVVIESKISTILGDAAQAIIRKFREININNMQKRSPWYSNGDVVNAITNAANDQDMTIVPMWTGRYSNADTSKIAKLVTTVSDPKSNLSGYSWAGDFVTLSEGNGGMRQDDLDKKLLNYFLFGKKDIVNVSPVKLSGSKLSSTVSDMFKYLNDYKSIIQTTTQVLDKAVVKTYATTESFGIDSYSNLLGMNVRDTDLSVLFEAGGTESGTGMGNSGVASANRGTSSEKESGTSMTKPVKNDTLTDGSNKSSDRVEAARFAKRVIRAYITSIEMRFVLYFNTINDCAPSEYKYSKWMKDHNSNINESTKPKRNK